MTGLLISFCHILGLSFLTTTLLSKDSQSSFSLENRPEPNKLYVTVTIENDTYTNDLDSFPVVSNKSTSLSGFSISQNPEFTGLKKRSAALTDSNSSESESWRKYCSFEQPQLIINNVVYADIFGATNSKHFLNYTSFIFNIRGKNIAIWNDQIGGKWRFIAGAFQDFFDQTDKNLTYGNLDGLFPKELDLDPEKTEVVFDQVINSSKTSENSDTEDMFVVFTDLANQNSTLVLFTLDLNTGKIVPIKKDLNCTTIPLKNPLALGSKLYYKDGCIVLSERKVTDKETKANLSVSDLTLTISSLDRSTDPPSLVTINSFEPGKKEINLTDFYYHSEPQTSKKNSFMNSSKRLKAESGCQPGYFLISDSHISESTLFATPANQSFMSRSFVKKLGEWEQNIAMFRTKDAGMALRVNTTSQGVLVGWLTGDTYKEAKLNLLPGYNSSVDVSKVEQAEAFLYVASKSYEVFTFYKPTGTLSVYNASSTNGQPAGTFLTNNDDYHLNESRQLVNYYQDGIVNTLVEGLSYPRHLNPVLVCDFKGDQGKKSSAPTGGSLLADIELLTLRNNLWRVIIKRPSKPSSSGLAKNVRILFIGLTLAIAIGLGILAGVLIGSKRREEEKLEEDFQLAYLKGNSHRDRLDDSSAIYE